LYYSVSFLLSHSGETFAIGDAVFEVKECTPNPCIVAPQTEVFVVSADAAKAYRMLPK
jgi:hypothetical protein